MKQRICTLLSLITILLFLLTACSDRSTSANGSTTTSELNQHPNTLQALTGNGDFREYALPQNDSGMMRPAIDHEGRIWFGEMGHNYLSVFDPRTQKFEQMTPPEGQSGIMGVIVAPDDTIWFAEQYANYIGHYLPTTKHYQLYRLPTLQIPDPGNPNNTLTLPSAPNDLTIDAQGIIWFTEMNSDSIGVLNSQNGQIKHYQLSAKKTHQTLNPYGITSDRQGMIWFTEASSKSIGRLDPKTGAVHRFTMPNASSSLMEIASDAHGTIWATAFNNGLLLSFDPQSETFTPFYAPFTGTPGGLYDLIITPNGEIWVTITAENAIARLDLVAKRFIYYAIPTQGSIPLGLGLGPDHTIWFTESGSNKIGMLKPA